MVQLIKKGGLRERANRSRSYHGSENTETTLKPNTYQHNQNKEQVKPTSPVVSENTQQSDSSKNIK